MEVLIAKKQRIIEEHKFTCVKLRLHTVCKIQNAVKNYTLCITVNRKITIG